MTTCSVEGCGKPARRNGLCAMHSNRLRRHGDATVRKGAGNGETRAWLRAHVNHDGEGCLIWPFSRYRNGYGKASDDDGRAIVASRLMCELAHGPPPTPSHEAAHSCGRGHEGCVHPHHLHWATPVENNADKVAHGTSYRGSRHHRASITEAEARAILAMGGPTAEIARRFGVSNWTVRAIKTGRSWGWL